MATNGQPEILIVEDSRLQARRLKKFLESQGYEVRAAANGQEGLAEVRSKKPGLIITDIIMPVMDGFDMCHSIRTDSDLYDIPIVMLTSLTNPDDVLRGLAAGADCYVCKPYEERILLSRIGSVLSLPRLKHTPELDGKIQVVLRGKRYVISASRHQILSLLLSTYEDAVLQNLKLRDMRAKLVAFNETLEKKVAERTAELRTEISERKKAQAEREKLITDLTTTRDALQYKATHDDLTNHWNRAAILRTLQNELARAKRERRPVGVAITDIDHFKLINDNFGHLAGDAVLRATAHRIAAAMRPYDTVGRYGGEEFLLVLPGCDAESSRLVSERLRLSFSEKPIRTNEGLFQVTLSFGVTSVHPDSSTDMDSAIRNADKALYRAKNGGRNRVEVWEEAPNRQPILAGGKGTR